MRFAPILLPILGLLDKTLFLCARGEHYWTTIMVFVMASDFIPGAKAVHAALWFWAGFSKLNHHFPPVVCVMTSNGPFTRFPWLRRKMYRAYPTDLRPSTLANVVAHVGTDTGPRGVLCAKGRSSPARSLVGKAGPGAGLAGPAGACRAVDSTSFRPRECAGSVPVRTLSGRIRRPAESVGSR